MNRIQNDRRSFLFIKIVNRKKYEIHDDSRALSTLFSDCIFTKSYCCIAKPKNLFIIPGLICFALAKKGVVPGLEQVYDPATGHAAAASQGAFPLMVAHLLPPGLRGIVVAGLLSALMGSLAGVFNACSTLFTVDIYEKLRPGQAQHQIVRVGRIATAVMVVLAIAWIPVVKGRGSLYGTCNRCRDTWPRRCSSSSSSASSGSA